MSAKLLNKHGHISSEIDKIMHIKNCKTITKQFVNLKN